MSTVGSKKRRPDFISVDMHALAQELQRHWSRETSSDPARWSTDNPAWGQCAVTALVVQDLCEGDLLRAEVDGISHYWNRLPSGEELDLTRQQFGPLAEVPDGELRDRAYVLSFPETKLRYENLVRRLPSEWRVTTKR